MQMVLKNRNNNRNNNNNKEDYTFASCSQIIYSIIDKLITIVVKKQYTIDKIFVNIATITEILMILTDKYYFLNCIEKKFIVSQAMDIFIKEKLSYIIPMDDNAKKELILTLQTVPIIIDICIATKRGKYNINNKQIMNQLNLKTKRCFGLFCSKSYTYDDD